MNNRNAEKLDNDIPVLSPEMLSILLKDHTTGGNIFWATDNYANRGDGYQYFDQIAIESIAGDNVGIIIPRSEKTKLQQKKRSREMAEIFTPSWVCNKMINLLDERWFERTETWTNVPMQDFTDKSDIDWSQSVENIDRQLYKKYGLTDDEIKFVESMIKPMQ